MSSDRMVFLTFENLIITHPGWMLKNRGSRSQTRGLLSHGRLPGADYVLNLSADEKAVT
jgi:hypothetical protein